MRIILVAFLMTCDASGFGRHRGPNVLRATAAGRVIHGDNGTLRSHSVANMVRPLRPAPSRATEDSEASFQSGVDQTSRQHRCRKCVRRFFLGCFRHAFNRDDSQRISRATSSSSKELYDRRSAQNLQAGRYKLKAIKRDQRPHRH